MVISTIDEQLDTRMYQLSSRLNYQTKDIQNLTNQLKSKLQRPAISVFNMSSNLIKQVKQSSKESTHIFITSIEDDFVIGSLDIRDEDKIFTLHELNGKRSGSFRKFISTDTFQRVINVDNYIVTVSYGDFVSFESIKNNHTIVLQEQTI